ncbi:MAG: hypothetical protein AB1696_02555 [Planctomycetota bacterium]
MPEQANDALKQVLQLFSEAKEALLSEGKRRAGEAADWEMAKMLFSIAEATDDLRRQASEILDGKPEPVQTPAVRDVARKGERLPKKEYPKFFIRGNMLVKQGLTRNRKETYEHTVSKEHFDSIVAMLAEEAKNRTEFLGPALAEKANCAPYEFYVVLAWLKHVGLVETQRRGQYRFVSPNSLESDAHARWKQEENA